MKDKVRIKKDRMMSHDSEVVQDPRILVSSQPENFVKLPFGMLTSPFIS